MGHIGAVPPRPSPPPAAAAGLFLRHLTSNWFHQTWELHCYLVQAASGQVEGARSHC